MFKFLMTSYNFKSSTEMFLNSSNGKKQHVTKNKLTSKNIVYIGLSLNLIFIVYTQIYFTEGVLSIKDFKIVIGLFSLLYVYIS